ncbi:hypothetical protein AB1Y20_013881 [Prymnesium parvum]|uniref:Lipase maturation factor n=1 Tax=Prymnesium parvum TaxID=97485 RepID=A0AB34IGM6_PRYPA
MRTLPHATCTARSLLPPLIARAPLPFAALPPSPLPSPSFWLGRSLALRWLGGCYFVAFLIALRQNKPLIGTHGLSPLRHSLAASRAAGHGFFARPTFFSQRGGDAALDAHAWAGLLLAAPLALTGAGGAPQLLALFALYTSLVNVGQAWYAFGWETLLLETGFLAIFLCPLRPAGAFPSCLPPPQVVVWAFRWLLFRVMLGAGLIKWRGDRCWRPDAGEPSAMDYFYETQPVPSPLSRRFHHMPRRWHRFETAAGLWVVELLTPPLLLLPGAAPPLVGVRTAAAVVQIAFQLVLIASGNLAFLNWLTIVPAFFCLPDAFLLRFAPSNAAAAATAAAAAAAAEGPSRGARAALHCALALLLARGSVPVVRNLLARGGRQAMNRSYGPLRLVNTYGAFGSVTRERYEVVLEGTREEYPTEGADWREYEFVAKPGDVKRPPRWLSPYHLRLDWLMWFVPLSGARTHPWLFHFIAKLLQNDQPTSRLLRHNPFLEGEPPRFIRALLYEYSFASVEQTRRSGDYWVRRRVRQYLAPQSLKSLRPILAQNGWLDE